MWTVTDFQQLKFQYWDGEDYCVVYNDRTGDLHLVDLVGVQILTSIGAQSRAYSELKQALSRSFDSVAEDILDENVTASVIALENAGLLAKVDF